MGQILLFYLVLISLSTGILLKLSEIFWDTIGNRFHVIFLGYTNWFVSIRISQMKDHSISVYQARYDTSIVSKYFDNVTVKTSTYFYKTNFPYYMIFTKADVSTIDEQIYKLTRKINIHYRACIGLLIYLLSKILYLSFAVHKLANYSSNLGKVHFEGLVHFEIH